MEQGRQRRRSSADAGHCRWSPIPAFGCWFSCHSDTQIPVIPIPGASALLTALARFPALPNERSSFSGISDAGAFQRKRPAARWKHLRIEKPQPSFYYERAPASHRRKNARRRGWAIWAIRPRMACARERGSKKSVNKNPRGVSPRIAILRLVCKSLEEGASRPKAENNFDPQVRPMPGAPGANK